MIVDTDAGRERLELTRNVVRRLPEVAAGGVLRLLMEVRGKGEFHVQEMRLLVD